MRLFGIELTRFWSRRITWVTLLVVSLCMVGGVAIAFTQTSKDVPTATPGPRINQACVRDLSRIRDEGEPEFEGLSDEEIGEMYCAESFDDGDRRFFATYILGTREVEDWSEFRAVEEPTSTQVVGGETYRSSKIGLEGIVPGVGVFLLIIGVVLGGSFVGAEYRSGTVENLLLWEPRRLKVLATKAAAGFVSSAAVMAIMMACLTILLLALAQFRGTFQGIDGRFWADWVLTVGRAGLMAGCFFVLAMALATVAKNTTAAVAALLGWFVVSNILIELFARPARHFELFTNAAAFVSFGEVSRYVGSGFDRTLVYSHGPWVAGLVVAIWMLVPGLIALAVFRRRDVS